MMSPSRFALLIVLAAFSAMLAFPGIVDAISKFFNVGDNVVSVWVRLRSVYDALTLETKLFLVVALLSWAFAFSDRWGYPSLRMLGLIDDTADLTRVALLRKKIVLLRDRRDVAASDLRQWQQDMENLRYEVADVISERSEAQAEIFETVGNLKEEYREAATWGIDPVHNTWVAVAFRDVDFLQSYVQSPPPRQSPWIPRTTRSRLSTVRPLADKGGSISVLEAARRAYEQTRGLPAAMFAEMEGDEDQILTWYCYALSRYVHFRGARLPSRKVESLPTNVINTHNFRRVGDAIILQSRYDGAVYENLEIDAPELNEAIARISTWGQPSRAQE